MKIRPENFDVLGVFVFASITAIALYALTADNVLPKWVLFYLLLVGVGGLIVDGMIVYLTFIKKNHDIH